MGTVKETLVALGFLAWCRTCFLENGRRGFVAHIEEKGIFKKNECVEAEFRTVRCLVCGTASKMEIVSHALPRPSFLRKKENGEYIRYVSPFLISLINDPKRGVDKNLVGDLCEILG